MAKRWISSKQWSTVENSTTEYLVSKGANGNIAYETIPQGQTKKTLVSNGVGNVSWQNLTIPLPEYQGTINLEDGEGLKNVVVFSDPKSTGGNKFELNMSSNTARQFVYNASENNYYMKPTKDGYFTCIDVDSVRCFAFNSKSSCPENIHKGIKRVKIFKNNVRIYERILQTDLQDMGMYFQYNYENYNNTLIYNNFAVRDADYDYTTADTFKVAFYTS